MLTRIITLLLLTLALAQDITDVFPERCRADPCQNVTKTPSCDTCLCGNKLLGPANFSITSDDSYNILFNNYTRFDKLCPSEFLNNWTQAQNRSRWDYPPQNGFVLDPNNPNKTMTQLYTLPIGFQVDRFGPRDGRFLASVGTPYSWRSLPPDSLNEKPNYWVWKVNKSIQVLGGRSAPAFEQPGGGLQFYIPDKISALEKNETLVLVKPVQ